MRLLAVGVGGAMLLSMACGAAASPASPGCAYMLGAVAVAAPPANAYPSEWRDTKQGFRITLVDRETGAVSEMVVPECKRDEARRLIADRRAQDRGQSSQGIPMAERTYQ